MRMLFLFLLLSTTAFGMNEVSVKLADFRIHPSAPVVGDEVTVLIIPEKFTGDIELNSYVEGSFESEDVYIEKLNKDVWKFNSVALEEARDYTLTARIFIEDKLQSEITRKEIEKLTREIARLTAQIRMESDPIVLERLTAEKENKEADRDELLNFLSSLRRFVGEEIFRFTVTAGKGN